MSLFQMQMLQVVPSFGLTLSFSNAIVVHLRHQAMQLALTFMCGISQLSPGAYFLRRDLFPAIAAVSDIRSANPVLFFHIHRQFINSPETEQFTFEAVLLLSLMANFHKSDGAAMLNPYLRCIKETTDEVRHLIHSDRLCR
jgi:hypothetical protein